MIVGTGKKIKQHKEKKDSFTYTENSNKLRQHVVEI